MSRFFKSAAFPILIVVVLAGFSIQLAVDIYSVVPRLHSDIRQIQKIDFICATVRLLLILGLVYLFAVAGLAVTIASAAFLLQYFLLRAYAAKMVDLEANENAEDRREIVRLIKSLAANALFYCFQGQITVFLISFFGHHAGSVAEVGALGRLARRVAAAPATAATGVRTALSLIRSRDPFLLGAVGWWGFDIAVLWACFHAFGASPPKAGYVRSV